MRKFVLATFTSLIAFAAVPAHATLADRKSDETHFDEAQAAPYSGQVVIRGEVRSEKADKDAAEPAPYSGQVVIRGEVKSESHG